MADAKAENALKCAMLLMFEREELADFPYFLGGSAFCVHDDKSLWVITAKHCVEKFDVVPQNLRLLPHIENQAFLRPTEVVRPSAKFEDDQDHADFLLYRVSLSALNENDLNKLRPFSLSRQTAIRADDPKIQWFRFRGYPLAINSIDYEQKQIRTQAFDSHANFSSKDTSEHCYRLTYPRTDQLDDPNGLSGSPVVAVHGRYGDLDVALTGMIIRGGKGSEFLTIVGVEMLISAIEKASK